MLTMKQVLDRIRAREEFELAKRRDEKRWRERASYEAARAFLPLNGLPELRRPKQPGPTIKAGSGAIDDGLKWLGKFALAVAVLWLLAHAS